MSLTFGLAGYLLDKKSSGVLIAAGSALVIITTLVSASLLSGVGQVTTSSKTPPRTVQTSSSTFVTSPGEFVTTSATVPELTYTSTDSLGLRLQVILNSTTVSTGGSEGAEVSVFNFADQSLSMVVNSSSSSILSWNGYDYFCNGVDSPVHYVVGYALFEGHVTSGNVSSSSPLLLAPEVGVGCVLYSGPPDVAIFPSDSGNATLSGPDLPPVSEQISLNGTTLYCTGNASGGYCGLGDSISGWWNMTSNQFASAATLDSPYYTPLQPGEYTLVAQDAFAQTVYAYFEVT